MFTLLEPSSLVREDEDEVDVDSLMNVLFFSPCSCLAIGKRFWDDVVRSVTDLVREKRPFCSKAYEVFLLNLVLSLLSFLKSQIENAGK